MVGEEKEQGVKKELMNRGQNYGKSKVEKEMKRKGGIRWKKEQRVVDDEAKR